MRVLNKETQFNNKNISNIDRVIQMIGLATRARKTVFGTDAVTMEMAKGKVKMVFVSTESSDNTKNKFINKCEYYKAKLVIKLNCTELMKATGKDNLMVVGITDMGFVNNLNNLLKEDVKNES